MGCISSAPKPVHPTPPEIPVWALPRRRSVHDPQRYTVHRTPGIVTFFYNPTTEPIPVYDPTKPFDATNYVLVEGTLFRKATDATPPFMQRPASVTVPQLKPHPNPAVL